MPLFERVLAGETVHEKNTRFETSGTASYWDIILAPLIEDSKISGILHVTFDVTERVLHEQQLKEINATLKQRIHERTEETESRRKVAESLRDIIGMINSNLPLDDLLQRSVELAAAQLGAAACVLHHLDLENKVITQMASFGMECIFKRGGRRHFSVLKPSGGDKYLQATLENRPTYGNYPPLPERVEEIRRDPTIPQAIKTERIALRQKFAGSFSAPLFIQDKVFGGMVFYYTEPQEFHDEQIQLGLVFAEQMAVAIENARLFEEAEQRRQVAEGLHDILIILNSNHSLKEILEHIIAFAVRLLGAHSGIVYHLKADSQMLMILAGYQIPEKLTALEKIPLYKGGAVQRMFDREPYVISDIQAHLEQSGSKSVFPESSASTWLDIIAKHYQAYLGIPLVIGEDIYGSLGLYYKEAKIFNSEQIELGTILANQAVLAIENARLFEKAEEAAIEAERNRLARDLHDAVTQTLFSASMIADVLPKIWQRNPEEGQRRLEELRQLTRGALSEMRTLLVELRPAALLDIDLEDLISHQINAFIARARIAVEFDHSHTKNPPPEIKEMFYRITQEALNNIAKHAEATHVHIQLDCQSRFAELVIKDNGIGFDPKPAKTQGLGLTIMAERARNAGALFDIQSQVGQGARLQVTWNNNKDRELKND